MTIPVGEKEYSASASPVEAEGIRFTSEELGAALDQRIPSMIVDAAGKKKIEEFLTGLAKTAFTTDRLKAALSTPPPVKDWQVGEAMAEAYLVDHRSCEFPWPTGRDLRNPKSSPAGADLVGFQNYDGVARFAFGEVKTSEEERWPPQVVTGRHGLANQLEDLRDSIRIKDHLAIVYLGHRAPGSIWADRYRQSVLRYLENTSDVSLFGFLIRDVTPNADDLRSRAEKLAKGCPTKTSIELRAFYLPAKSIGNLASRIKANMGGAN